MKKFISTVVLSLIPLCSAMASPATDAAKMHFKAIAATDVSAIMHNYGVHPQLNWVGGAFDGTYQDRDAIKMVWDKFCKAMGPSKLHVLNLKEVRNSKGATVMALLHLKGRNPLKVQYLLTYRDGLLVNETWQIDQKKH